MRKDESTCLVEVRTTNLLRLNFYRTAIDKTQLSLHPAALRRLYSAKSRYCPDPLAQTLFDLLNHRDFALSLPYRNSLQRRSPSPSGDICTTATRPLGLVRKEGGANAYFSSTRKGYSPSLDNALWASPFGSCPAPMRRIRPSLFDFRGVDFSAVLKFTGQR